MEFLYLKCCAVQKWNGMACCIEMEWYGMWVPVTTAFIFALQDCNNSVKSGCCPVPKLQL